MPYPSGVVNLHKLTLSLGFSQFVDECPEGTFELQDATAGKVCGKIAKLYVVFRQNNTIVVIST